MRVAITHDYLTQFGGAERVLQALMEIFPQAPVFTLLYDRVGMRVPFDDRRIHTSFLQRVPSARRHHRYFPLLMPLAIEQFDFSEYDVVLSATHSYSKGVITPPHTMHVSYCFTPTRYLWDDSHRYVREFSRWALSRHLAPIGLSRIRLWDYFAAQRVDHYVTLSRFVSRRIKKYYGREAHVIFPPIDVQRFAVPPQAGDYYLIVSRLVPYKQIDQAIAACEALHRPLKIAGIGPEYASLRQRAGRYTEFLGFVPEDSLPALYAGARALLFPQEEDFGMTPLEAAAAGKPTIAYGSGGARETIIPGVTGLLYESQSTAALADAIRQFETMQFDPQAITRHARGFDRPRFVEQMRTLVDQLWQRYQTAHVTRERSSNF